MLAWIQAKVAAIIGDIWVSPHTLAIFPYPATLYGHSETKTVGHDYRFFSIFIKPGDILLTTQKNYKGSNKAISGMFKHLMVYTGPVRGAYDRETREIIKPRSMGVGFKNLFQANKDFYKSDIFLRTVTHAVSEGVGTYDLLDIFFHYDYICVVRPWKTVEQQTAIVEAALSQVGKDYNFDFTSEGDPALYCTELGAFCLEAAGIRPPEQIRQMTRFWKPWEKNTVFLADYFATSFPIVCTTASCNFSKGYKKSPARDMLRKKLLNASDFTIG